MSKIDKAIENSHVHEIIRNAVLRGNGEEALRLANKHKVPNVIRLGLGVELSDNPNEAPELKAS